MRKNTTESKLIKSVVALWGELVCRDTQTDFEVNDILENFVRSCGVAYDGSDIARTVANLSNSQKRALYRQLKRKETQR